MRGSIALAVAIFVAGCAAPQRCEPRFVAIVPTAPPAALPEAITSPPTPDMDWIQGYWAWDGDHWVWSPGHWATRPKGQWWNPPELSADATGQLRWTAPGYGCWHAPE